MTIHDLGHKLDPARYPNMSPQMVAIVGYLFERAYTTPALAELTVTPDGHLYCKTLMDTNLEHRLRICYPTGFHGEVARDQIDLQPAQIFWEHFQPLLESHGFYCGGPDLWSNMEHVVEFPVYRLGEPPNWFFSDNRAEKIEDLRVRGTPHIALVFKVSTILPALSIDIQETWFNPETYGNKAKGKHDDGLMCKHFQRVTAFEPWASLIIATRELAKRLALQEFEEETLKEDVSFVTHPIWSDEEEDDYSDNLSDEAFHEYMKNQPQYVCCLYDCLFGFV